MVWMMKGGWQGTQRRNYHPVQDCWAARILLCTIWYSEFYGVLLYNLRRLESLGIHSIHSVHITLSTVVHSGAWDLWWSAFPYAPQNSWNFIGILLYNLHHVESLCVHSVHNVHIALSTVVRPGAQDLWQLAFQYAPQNSLNFIGILLYNLHRLESPTSTMSTSHPARSCVPVHGIFGGEVYAMHHIVFQV